MSELPGEDIPTAQVKSRNRGRVTGVDIALVQVKWCQTEVEEAQRALLQARRRRAEAVRGALAAGWSVRGLAEALGVNPKWVQRAQRQD